MRRSRNSVLMMLCLVMAGLLLPAGPAGAQVEEEELTGVITGSTRTPDAPTLEHQSRCGSFDQVVITVSAERAEPAPRLVTGQVEQPVGQNVGFCTRETIAVGEGRLTATDAASAFRNRVNDAVEVHGDESGFACIEIRLEDGEFNRVGNVAVARITIDYQMKRA